MNAKSVQVCWVSWTTESSVVRRPLSVAGRAGPGRCVFRIARYLRFHSRRAACITLEIKRRVEGWASEMESRNGGRPLKRRCDVRRLSTALKRGVNESGMYEIYDNYENYTFSFSVFGRDGRGNAEGRRKNSESRCGGTRPTWRRLERVAPLAAARSALAGFWLRPGGSIHKIHKICNVIFRRFGKMPVRASQARSNRSGGAEFNGICMTIYAYLRLFTPFYA